MAPLDKFQRWVDLLVALLRHRAGLTFDDLVRQVPGYAAALARDGSNRESVKRTFERDKAELRDLGVPIDKDADEGDEETPYRMRTTDFYLPYLALATPRGQQDPARVARYGYQSLETLAFLPEELLAVAEGAARARQLGDPALTGDVEHAMRKLAFDLPLDGVVSQHEAHVVQPRAAADPALLEQLGDALLGRKRLTITYRGMDADETGDRSVEPWGLFWSNGNWYLAARDARKDALRNFRVSRIVAAGREDARHATPDFEIPQSFDLRAHARTRQPWELGDGEIVDAVVSLQTQTGAVMAAAALGAPVDGEPGQRRYAVRRMDAFVRWLLSFAGAIAPVSPALLVEEHRRQVETTLALYADSRQGSEGGA